MSPNPSLSVGLRSGSNRFEEVTRLKSPFIYILAVRRFPSKSLTQSGGSLRMHSFHGPELLICPRAFSHHHSPRLFPMRSFSSGSKMTRSTRRVRSPAAEAAERLSAHTVQLTTVASPRVRIKPSWLPLLFLCLCVCMDASVCGFVMPATFFRCTTRPGTTAVT